MAQQLRMTFAAITEDAGLVLSICGTQSPVTPVPG